MSGVGKGAFIPSRKEGWLVGLAGCRNRRMRTSMGVDRGEVVALVDYRDIVDGGCVILISSIRAIYRKCERCISESRKSSTLKMVLVMGDTVSRAVPIELSKKFENTMDIIVFAIVESIISFYRASSEFAGVN